MGGSREVAGGASLEHVSTRADREPQRDVGGDGDERERARKPPAARPPTRATELVLALGSAGVMLLAATAQRSATAAAPTTGEGALGAPTAPASSSASALRALPEGASPGPIEPESSADGCHFDEPVPSSLGAPLVLDLRGVRGLLSLPLATQGDGLDLVVHLHGGQAVRRLLGASELGVALLTIDAGERSSRYEQAAASVGTLSSLVERVARLATRELGREVSVRRVVLSSWSAGYALSARLLRGQSARVDGLALLDSLYAGMTPEGEVDGGPLRLFVERARAAEASGAPMFLSYSEVPTAGYASTGAVARYLTRALGGALEPRTRPGPGPSLVEAYERGALVVRGYAGSDAAAHCDHLRLLPGALRETLLPRAR